MTGQTVEKTPKALEKTAKSGIIEPKKSKEIPEVGRASAPRKPLAKEDVTGEYVESARPGQGSITYEEGYKVKGHQSEINIAGWLHRTFGGDIKLLKESKEPGDKTPDFFWRGAHWELKGATTKNSVDRAVREAAKQISAKPGGIILDVSESELSTEEIMDEITQRVRRIALDLVDVMIVSHENLEKILRYKK